MIAALALRASVTLFLIWVTAYCWRVGAVGSFWQGDATRSEQPLRFWTSIIALTVAAATMLCLFAYAIWNTLARGAS